MTRIPALGCLGLSHAARGCRGSDGDTAMPAIPAFIGRLEVLEDGSLLLEQGFRLAGRGIGRSG